VNEAYDRLLVFAARNGWTNLSVVPLEGVPFVVFDGGTIALGTILTMTESK
jgi:hypothetical protein